MTISFNGPMSFSGPAGLTVAAGEGGGYTITSGTKAPVLGAGAQATFPAAGWTQVIGSSQDDSSSALTLPFTITFNGESYSIAYPGSNFYITFGGGSTAYSNLTAANPPYNKIMIAAQDNSWQRTSYIASGTNYIRYRQEGTASTSGTVGSPNMVYEVTFFNPSLTSSNIWIELLVGQQARGTTGNVSGIYSSSALLSGGGLGPSNTGVSANQSYLLVGDPTGTTWTVYTGYYVGGTDY